MIGRMIPRTIAARLSAAVAVVSIAALLLGAWLIERVQADGPPLPSGLNRRLLLTFAGVLAVAALAAIVLLRRIVRPMGSLRDVAVRISRGDLDARATGRGGDEIAAIGRALDAVAERLRADEQLRRDMTADIVQELGTPLANLRYHLEALRDRVAAATPDTVSILLAEVLQLQRLVDDLADLARADAGQLQLVPEAVPLPPLVAVLVMELGPRLDAAGLTVQMLLAHDLPALRADRPRLAQVLRNLVENAIAHTPSGGRIRISARAVTTSVEFAAADTGIGIAPEHLAHVFDRAYRSDSPRARAAGGAGLGLALVRRIVLAHGGDVTAESIEGQGATFTVAWPAAASVGPDGDLTPP